MKAIRVDGDPNNMLRGSSNIIISSLNQGLKNAGLYSDSGDIVVYDCLGNSHGHETNHIICPYETILPNHILRATKDKTLIGVSVQNQLFFTEAGHPKDKTAVCQLGVDSKSWSPNPREFNEKFTFGMMCDSNSRAGYFELLSAFKAAFSKNEKVCLLIKDRYATETFKNYIQSFAAANELYIQLVDKHITDPSEEQAWYDKLDCHVFINKSSTFALTVAQGMAKAIPTITMAYSGPRDYCNELNSCLVDYTLEEISLFELQSLEQRGLRNYLFPPHSTTYPKQPKWAVPSVKSLTECLKRVYEDEAYRNLIGQQGRVTAETLSWDRAAINLSYILSK